LDLLKDKFIRMDKNLNNYNLRSANTVVVSLIGGVPRMGPRVPFALLPFGHCPIKYLKH
jgi:hypothetical protein